MGLEEKEVITWLRTLLSAKNTEPDQQYYSYCKWFFHDDGTASNIRLSQPVVKLTPPASENLLTDLDAQKAKS